MQKLCRTCIALITTTPLLLSGLKANAESLPSVTGHGAAALQSATFDSQTVPDNEPVATVSDESIRTREGFLLTKNCLNTKGTSLEAGIQLICQPRALPETKGVGPSDFQFDDFVADRDSFKLDLVQTKHSLEAGRSQGLGFRIRL